MIRDSFLEGGRRVCPVCGKEFWMNSEWMFRRGSGTELKWFCSYGCMRTFDGRKMTKAEKIRQAIRDGLSDSEIVKLLGVPLEKVLDQRWRL